MGDQRLPGSVNIYSSPARWQRGAPTFRGSGRQKSRNFSHEETVSDLYDALRDVSAGGRGGSRRYGQVQTVKGWVSDSKCGAKGANAGAAACTKKCIEGGASAVVVTDGDNKVLAVDNADALEGTRRASRSCDGYVKGDSIHVDSVKML